MQALAAHSSPVPSTLTRTSARAARVGAFALETWSRMLVDGSPFGIAERAQEMAWVAENMCALHGVRLLARGAVPRQACVLVANHISYFDPMILASQMPLVPLAKSEVAAWPVVGDLCRRLGAMFVDRDNGHSGARVLRTALSALRDDVSVLVFPEGTTTRGDRVLPFKRGIFGVAALAGVPVVPVALRYERTDAAWVGDDAFLPHYVRTMAQPCTRVSADFLSPLYPSEGVTAAALAETARTAILHSLRGVRPMPSSHASSRAHVVTAIAS